MPHTPEQKRAHRAKLRAALGYANLKTARRLDRWTQDGLKQCTKCGLAKPIDQFHKNSTHPDGLRPGCKTCSNEQNAQYYAVNREQITAKARVFNKTEHRKAYARKYMGAKLRKVRDLAATRPRPLFCEICGATGRIVFDHDHTTTKFRGWLCNRCNRVLGFCEDNAKVLRALAAYLENNR